MQVPDPASVLASSGDAIWWTSYPGNSVTRIDPAVNQATGTVSLAPLVRVRSASPSTVATCGLPTMTATRRHRWPRLDPATLQVVDYIPVGSGPSAGPTGIGGGAGSLWVDVPNSDAVIRIDPATDRVTATVTDTGVCASLVAKIDAAVWVASSEGDGCTGGVIKVDLATNQVVAHVNDGDGTVRRPVRRVRVVRYRPGWLSRAEFNPGSATVTRWISCPARRSGWRSAAAPRGSPIARITTCSRSRCIEGDATSRSVRPLRWTTVIVKNASHGAVVPVVLLMAARPVLDPDRSADGPGMGKAGAFVAEPSRAARDRADAPATVVLVDDHAGFRREAACCSARRAARGRRSGRRSRRWQPSPGSGQPSSSSTWVCPTSPVSTWSKRSDVWSHLDHRAHLRSAGVRIRRPGRDLHRRRVP